MLKWRTVEDNRSMLDRRLVEVAWEVREGTSSKGQKWGIDITGRGYPPFQASIGMERNRRYRSPATFRDRDSPRGDAWEVRLQTEDDAFSHIGWASGVNEGEVWMTVEIQKTQPAPA